MPAHTCWHGSCGPPDVPAHTCWHGLCGPPQTCRHTHAGTAAPRHGGPRTRASRSSTPCKAARACACVTRLWPPPPNRPHVRDVPRRETMPQLCGWRAAACSSKAPTRGCAGAARPRQEATGCRRVGSTRLASSGHATGKQPARSQGAPSNHRHRAVAAEAVAAVVAACRGAEREPRAGSGKGRARG